MKQFIMFFSTLLALGFVMQTQKAQTRVDNFTLNDYNGKQHALSDYSQSKAIVLMFIATQCPVSNDYNERMVHLVKKYQSQGITFIGINSNKQETIEDIKEHSNDNEFSFPVLKDWNNILADKLHASVTPEIFVLNPQFEVLYHGRIDDSRRQSDVKSEDLRLTLDAIVSGKTPDYHETKAFGCSIKRIKK